MAKTTIPDDEINAPLDIDMLMTLDPLKLGQADLDIIIQYHRNIRAAREAGKGRAKGVAAAPPKGVAALLNAKPKSTITPAGRRGF